MKNLLSSKEKRQLELMEFLVTSHEWIHLKNLAEKFLCTERILKQDLAELREIFPQVAIHSSTNGIKAHFSKEMSIEDIYRYFFINSQNFSLLEYIFFHEGENISEVSNAFYTTSANLYRIVSKIVKEINPHYQFSIQLTPVTVIGNEIDVRYFYAQYFSERYYFLDWPFFDIDEDILIEFANYFYKPTNYPMRFATYRMYKYMIAIGIYRVKGKHFALLPNNFMEKIYPIYEQLPDFKEKITYFSEKLHIDLTPENLAQIFISFIQESIFLNPDEFYNTLEKNDYSKNSYQLLSDMLMRITSRIHIQFRNFEELIWYMHNTVHLERQETFTDPLLFRQKEKTIDNFEQYFPEVFKILNEEILIYLKNMNRKHTTEHIKHLVYTLFTHSEEIVPQLLYNRPQIKVLVISNFDHAHSMTLIDILRYYCNKSFIFENWCELETTTEILNQTDYDIIIANFYIPGLKKQFICNNNITIMELVNHLNTLSNQIH